MSCDNNECKETNINERLESLAIKIADYLESNHQDITFDDKSRQLNTILMLSVRNNDLKTVKIILSHMVDININDYDGLTPLLSSVINHNTDMTRLLFEYNADPNICDINGWSPLMVSIANHDNNENNSSHSNKPIIELLLNNKADVGKSNDSGYTPMIICAMNGEMDIMKMLVERNANVNEKDNENISVFAHAVMFAGRNNKNKDVQLKNEMLDYLIEKGTDIHHSNINMQSALFLAAHNGYYDMVKYCVEKKMDYNQRDIYGINPMEQAYNRGFKEIANYLANKITSIK